MIAVNLICRLYLSRVEPSMHTILEHSKTRKVMLCPVLKLLLLFGFMAIPTWHPKPRPFLSGHAHSANPAPSSLVMVTLPTPPLPLWPCSLPQPAYQKEARKWNSEKCLVNAKNCFVNPFGVFVTHVSNVFWHGFGSVAPSHAPPVSGMVYTKHSAKAKWHVLLQRCCSVWSGPSC